MTQTNPTHMDLFSGIGGFALAAKWAGFETTSFCEIDPFCREVLKKHWPNVLKYLDIKDISKPDHVDLLTGGFPCQGFSIAGKRKGIHDERYMWPEMFRIIKFAKPAWVVAENVTGIIPMALDNILTDLENESYETRVFILPACAANAPHRRDRVWIIANADGQRFNLWSDSRKERFLQNYKERNNKTLQSKWEKLKPESWTTFTVKDWLKNNANFKRDDHGVSVGMDKNRVKALGNAIVPQVVYPILKMIYEIQQASNQ